MTRIGPAFLVPSAFLAALAASGVALHSRSGPFHSPRSGIPSPGAAAAEGAWNALVSCGAENARENTGWPLKNATDFVPLATDDSLGFYVAYSTRTSNGRTPDNNVCQFVFPLDGGEVLLFGAGYGIDPVALNDAAYDAAQVDAILRGCLGRDPASTPIRFISPHWHGDHINPAFLRALANCGWSVVEILYHEDDDWYIRNYYNWTAAERAKFTLFPHQSCNVELTSFASPLGKIWFVSRKGHAPGAIDAVIDVRDNPADRVVVRGSVDGGYCPDPPDGTRVVIDAHGNVLLPPSAEIVPYGCGVNPPDSLRALGGAPRLGARVVLGVDDPTGSVAAGSLPYLWTSLAPDSHVPCGTPLDLPGLAQAGEVLLGQAPGDLVGPPLAGAPWTGPGSPCPFAVDIPGEAILVGTSVFHQGLLIDVAGGPGHRIVLTDAVELRIGP
ncbi:MAG: hypothetical protein AB1726_01125 [Planctomycetota bacterium]